MNDLYLTPHWLQSPTRSGFLGGWAANLVLMFALVPVGIQAARAAQQANTPQPQKGWRQLAHLTFAAGGHEPLSHCKGQWRAKGTSKPIYEEWLDDSECELNQASDWSTCDGEPHYGYQIWGQQIVNVIEMCRSENWQFRLVPQGEA